MQTLFTFEIKIKHRKCSRYGFFSRATKQMPNNRGQMSTKRKEWTEKEEEEKNEHTSKMQPKLPRLCIATEFCKTMQNAKSASYIKKNNNVYFFHFLVHLSSNSLFVYMVLILAMCKWSIQIEILWKERRNRVNEKGNGKHQNDIPIKMWRLKLILDDKKNCVQIVFFCI